MPAAQLEDLSAIPRIALLDAGEPNERQAVTVVDAPRMLEGAGFEVRRAFAELDLRLVDPFLLLDHLGAVGVCPRRIQGGARTIPTAGSRRLPT